MLFHRPLHLIVSTIASFLILANGVENEDVLVSSINQFSLDLYKQLASSNKGNFVSSPLCVDILMSVVLTGARNETAQQINKTLHYDDGEKIIQFRKSFRSLLKSLNSDIGNNSLISSNSIWVQKKLQQRKGFTKSTKNNFLTSLKKVDFSKGKKAKDVINSCVKNATRGLISTLFDEEFDNDTNAVLGNAIYFKGLWENKFDIERTSDQVFYSGKKGILKRVPMMNQVGQFGYKKDSSNKMSLLEMKYAGSNLTMIILLPFLNSDTTQLEKNLNLSVLQEFLASQTPSEVNVSIPRFEDESVLQLRSPLVEMGIKDAFQCDAKLPGLGKGIFVARVTQKVKVQINEEGIDVLPIETFQEAPRAQPAIFRADRPFVYIILDRSTGVIFLMGRVQDIN